MTKKKITQLPSPAFERIKGGNQGDGIVIGQGHPSVADSEANISSHPTAYYARENDGSNHDPSKFVEEIEDNHHAEDEIILTKVESGPSRVTPIKNFIEDRPGLVEFSILFCSSWLEKGFRISFHSLQALK